MPKPEPVKNPQSYAIWLLGRRDYSRAELRAKLLNRTAQQTDVETVLDYLAGEGYLDDRRFAESRVRYLALSGGKGPQHIRQALKAKGIADPVINELLTQEEIDWYELAKAARLRKFGDELPSEFKVRAKQQQFLLNRGFSFDHIRYAMTAADE